MTKKNHPRQLRSRTTRSSKPRLLTDPTSSTQLLTTQLQSLGLYAAPTVGDGNCLFRALSDQVHGSPEKHREIRRQVCDWIEQHKERYEGFVEDDDYLLDEKSRKKGATADRDKGKGLEAHLRYMRQNATYGGHMELSAFAHLTKRNIKVIQPGLVYVIEWHAGESPTPNNNLSQDQFLPPEPRRSKRTQRPTPSSSSKHSSNSNQDENQQIVKIGTGKHGYYVYEEITDDEDEVELSLLPHDNDPEESGAGETVYVAYHDWEHFSSIRNLSGPHAGLPHVKETSAQIQREREKEGEEERARKEREKGKGKKIKEKERERDNPQTNAMKVKLKISPPSSIQPSLSLGSLSSLSSSNSSMAITPASADPTLIPLSNSRSISHRSPKRTFDESSASGEDGDGGSSGSGDAGMKRTRVGSVGVGGQSKLGPESAEIDQDTNHMDVDVDGDTPGLSAPGSSSEITSDSSSDLTSPSPPPHSIPVEVEPSTETPHSQPKSPTHDSKPLTRRQRKALGLPKPRPPGSAGKIIIPGGKWKGRQSQGAAAAVGVVDGDGGDEEWKRNGAGRVDVRGFRELKI